MVHFFSYEQKIFKYLPFIGSFENYSSKEELSSTINKTRKKNVDVIIDNDLYDTKGYEMPEIKKRTDKVTYNELYESNPNVQKRNNIGSKQIGTISDETDSSTNYTNNNRENKKTDSTYYVQQF